MIEPARSPTQAPDLLDAAKLYVATFSGRQDVYSYWAPDTPDPRTGDMIAAHWKAVRRPLSADRVLTAFRMNVPLSTYLLTLDSYTYVAALDIDRENGRELGKMFSRKLQSLGGICYLEPSARGCHLWMPLTDKRPAVLIRRALRALIDESGIPPCPGTGQRWVPNKQGKPSCPGCQKTRTDDKQSVVPQHVDPKVELRPGSDRLNGPDSLGHCIRMPTMPHHRTGKRYRLYSSDGEALPGKLADMMLAIEACPVEIFDEAAGRAPLPPLPSAPNDLRYPHGDPPTSGSVVEVLRNYWGVIEARPGTAIICPAHDDHNPSLSIARDDQRVWCKTGGCVLSNNGRGRGINELIRLAPSRGGS